MMIAVNIYTSSSSSSSSPWMYLVIGGRCAFASSVCGSERSGAVAMAPIRGVSYEKQERGLHLQVRRLRHNARLLVRRSPSPCAPADPQRLAGANLKFQTWSFPALPFFFSLAHHSTERRVFHHGIKESTTDYCSQLLLHSCSSPWLFSIES